MPFRCLLLIMLVIPMLAAAYDPTVAKPAQVATLDTTWHDSARNRDVPAKIYFPAKVDRAAPVIVFSHGLGASRFLYEYLGQYWAARGYVSVHVQHKGSDTDAIMANGFANVGRTGKQIAEEPQNAINRCLDVSFAIDQLTKLNDDKTSPLAGHLDLSKIAAAGHSFGGNTAMLIAGQVFLPTMKDDPYLDKRVKCAIAMSPPTVPSSADYTGSYGPIKIPMMVMSGTLDNAPISHTANAERVAAFDCLTAAPAVLVVLNGGDHIVFAGSRFGLNHPADDKQHKLICQSTTAFLDAYLNGDSGAKTWLQTGGLAAFASNAALVKVNTPAGKP